ncbi:MAG: dUTP diphosphatase [Acidobacteriota bacterium]
MARAPVAGIPVPLLRLAGHEDLPLPAYATAGAAGADLHAALREPLRLAPGERALVPTGFCLALPPGYEAQIRPRSGRAWQDGLTLLNSPGTIDADYRGELRILVVNLGQEPIEVRRGDRIAQMIVSPILRATFRLVAELPATRRGGGGFGHTGS